MKTGTSLLGGPPVVICAAIDSPGGRPLDRSTRAFVESRFARDFRHVRVHTGTGAAVAARALGARAFTLGPDIFFGAGQYAPETQAGLRLLAHELVHVVQQGPVRSESGIYPVGLSCDPLEAEADLVADQVLATGPLPPITRDSARVIRATIIVNRISAKILIDAKAANPAVHVDPFGFDGKSPTVNTHLTNNFVPGAITAAGATATAAWTAAGGVGLIVSAGDQNISNWNFGFIQFQSITQVSLFYSGRAKSDGGIVVNAGVPAALRQKLGRDCDTLDANPPWMRVGTSSSLTFNRSTGLASGVTGDHPQMIVPAIQFNAKTGHDNFLFQLIDDREFFTTFSARDHQGNFTHLANFAWSVRWHFTFGWKPGGIPIPIKDPSTFFIMGNAVQGPLPQPALQPFLPNPVMTQRLGSPEMTAALRASAVGGPPNRTETDERFGPDIGPTFNP